MFQGTNSYRRHFMFSNWVANSILANDNTGSFLNSDGQNGRTSWAIPDEPFYTAANLEKAYVIYWNAGVLGSNADIDIMTTYGYTVDGTEPGNTHVESVTGILQPINSDRVHFDVSGVFTLINPGDGGGFRITRVTSLSAVSVSELWLVFK